MHGTGSLFVKLPRQTLSWTFVSSLIGGEEARDGMGEGRSCDDFCEEKMAFIRFDMLH